MDFALIVFVDMLRGVAWLILLASGLAIIFGMMRVINIAHGEFLMLGGYTVVISSQQGVPLFIGILILAPLVVGLFGIIVERLIIRWLYGRMLDSLLATWGLSLVMIGGITMIFGNTTEGVSAPLGSIPVSETYTIAVYNLVLILCAALFLIGIYSVLKFTRWGLIARSVMQNPGMAQALGVNATYVYMATFGVGAAVTGLAGGLLAPMTGVVPSMGVNFIGQAFITVVTGGAAVVAGTLSSAAALGSISQAVTFGAGPVYGDAALLVAALILLRVLPQGITGRIFTRSI